MRSKTLSFRKNFHVVFSTVRAQAAEMTIAPGESEGGAENRHSKADQWLFVVSGAGIARIEGRSRRLKPNVLVLIEHGDRHEIRNTGRAPLRTLNFYVPRAYGPRGATLPAGRE